MGTHKALSLWRLAPRIQSSTAVNDAVFIPETLHCSFPKEMTCAAQRETKAESAMMYFIVLIWLIGLLGCIVLWIELMGK